MLPQRYQRRNILKVQEGNKDSYNPSLAVKNTQIYFCDNKITSRKMENTMNQEQIQVVPKRNITTEHALFAIANLEVFHKDSPKTVNNTSRIEPETLNQTNQLKEKQAVRVNKPSITISSFACLCPACVNCGTN